MLGRRGNKVMYAMHKRDITTGVDYNVPML